MTLQPPVEPSDAVVKAYHATFPYSYGGRRLVEQGFQGGQLPPRVIREQLLKSEAFTRFRPYRRRKDAVPVYVYARRDQIQADVCFLPNHEQIREENDNKRYVLAFIDVFTKWVWVYALTTTTAEEVTHIFRTRFLTLSYVLLHLHTSALWLNVSTEHFSEFYINKWKLWEHNNGYNYCHKL